MTQLLFVVTWGLAMYCLLVVSCWFAGTSAKEVQRQIRLQALIGEPRRFD